MSNYSLELYKYNSCPFCNMVMEFIETNKINVEYKDILDNPENLKKLESDTGRRTVPCLYIDNKPMFESRDIINWLQKNCLEK